VADGQDTIGREETWPTSDPVYPQMSHRIDYIQIGPQRQTEKNHGKLSNTNIFFLFFWVREGCIGFPLSQYIFLNFNFKIQDFKIYKNICMEDVETDIL